MESSGAPAMTQAEFGQRAIGVTGPAEPHVLGSEAIGEREDSFNSILGKAENEARIKGTRISGLERPDCAASDQQAGES